MSSIKRFLVLPLMGLLPDIQYFILKGEFRGVGFAIGTIVMVVVMLLSVTADCMEEKT